MAIFIVDQFSLNTDLPLDIRYVPGAGRLDPDISLYKYPGMQVFDTNTESIWYADNSLNWVELGAGADASLNALYTLINDLSTYITTNVDVSISNLYNITNQLDASIQRIDVSLNDYGALLAIHDASIGNLYSWQVSQDASIDALRADHVSIDASIVELRGDITQIEASIARIDTSIGQLDAQIQINTSDILQIEASIADINSYQAIQDASILYNDSSIKDIYTKLGNSDASINELYNWNIIQDGSIATNAGDIVNIETSLGILNNWNISQDASIVALEASLGDYVRKDGDTMTGPLTISAGGLVVNNDISIGGNSVLIGDVQIGGDLTVDGSTTIINTQIVDISSNFIYLNTGLTGTPPAWLQSGIVVERGDASAYAVIFDETDKTFRIGIVWNPDASGVYQDTMTKPVAAREDNAIDTGIAYWKSTGTNNGLFDTDTTFTYTTTDGLKLDTSLRLTSLAGASDLMLVVQPNGYVKAVPTSDSSINDLYAYIDGSLAARDTSIAQNATDIATNTLQIAQLDASIVVINAYQAIQDASIIANENAISIIDGSITYLTNIVNIHEASIGDLYNITNQLDASIIRIDSSLTELYGLVGDTSVKGAINIGDGSAQVYAGLTSDGSLQFKEFVGANGVEVLQTGNLITVQIDSSFSGGEINTASNIGTGEGLATTKQGVDLPFKSLQAIDPSELIITSDASTIYFDVSIAPGVDASLVGLTDTSIDETELVDHTNMEYDASLDKWVNTDNLWWDLSLGTTTDDLGGIPAGTDLEGKTLKEILYQILYEYQIPTLAIGSNPVAGIYEKGLAATQFSSIDVSYYSTNANYPLAKLNNVHISKTGAGTIHDASLGLVSVASGSYTDSTGITNWGGTNRTITYNVTIDDDQSNQSQPAVGKSESFTFYYRQYWGMVDGNTLANNVDSSMIKGLNDSRLAGETDLTATFDNSTGGFIKYLFAYPDTVASPDNFGTLSQILDQNDFDVTDSFETQNEDVSVGSNNIRYRIYLLKHKVDTSIFDITFKF